MNTNENVEISVPFPPQISIQDLFPADRKALTAGNRSPKIPNAFIAFRIALVKELKAQQIVYDRTKVSTLASTLWAKVPEQVKKYYKDMSIEAQLQYNQARGLTFISQNSVPIQDDDFTLINISTLSLQQGTASTLSSAS